MKQAGLDLIGGWGRFAYYEQAPRWMVSYLTVKPVAPHAKCGQPTWWSSAVEQGTGSTVEFGHRVCLAMSDFDAQSLFAIEKSLE